MSFDSEFAFKRCVELMTELEAEAKRDVDGRILAGGLWIPHRKYVEAAMYVRLFDCTVRGFTLDEIIFSELEPYSKVRVGVVTSAPASLRRAALGHRNGEVPMRDVYTADGPGPIRNDARELDEGGEDFPIVL